LIHFIGNQKQHKTAKFNYWLLLTFANKSKIEKSDDAAVAADDDIVHKWCS